MTKTVHLCAILGALSQLLIPAGIVALFTMINSIFESVSIDHASTPESAIKGISSVIQQTNASHNWFLLFMGLAVVGLAVFCTTLIRFHYRRPWAFWFACIYGGCLVFMAPFGTPFGLFLLIYALIHRQEFGPSASGLPAPAA